jgi:hypothetical protein
VKLNCSEAGGKLTKQTKTTRLLYTVSLSPCRCPKSSPTSAATIRVLLAVSCVPMTSRCLYSSADRSIERCACSSALGRPYWSQSSTSGYSGVLALPLEDWLFLTLRDLLCRHDRATDCRPALLPLFGLLSRAHTSAKLISGLVVHLLHTSKWPLLRSTPVWW